MTWQPIETAEKVEGHLLLLFGDGKNFQRCSFVGCWWEGAVIPHWRAISNHDRCKPTHWMPLPDRPVQS